jgi:hypothetical protein
MIGRRIVTTGVVIAAVAAGGVAGAVLGVPGLSGASTTSTTSPKANAAPFDRGHRGGFGIAMGADKGVLDAAAKALGMSTDDLLTKLSDGKTTIADVAKSQNVDIQTVIDAMDAVAKSDITDFVNNPLPAPPSFKGGPDGKFGPGMGFGFRGARGGSLDAAAKALGITTDELRTDLAAGQSIADIAKAKNVDVNTVIDALVADAKTKLDDAVKNKDLSQDEATKIEADLKAHITDLVNNTAPKGMGRFGGGFRGHMGFGGADGPGEMPPMPGAAASTSGAPNV